MHKLKQSNGLVKEDSINYELVRRLRRDGYYFEAEELLNKHLDSLESIRKEIKKSRCKNSV